MPSPLPPPLCQPPSLPPPWHLKTRSCSTGGTRSSTTTTSKSKATPSSTSSCCLGSSASSHSSSSTRAGSAATTAASRDFPWRWHSERDPASVPDAAAIDRLPIVLHGSASSEVVEGSGECSMCLGAFEDGEKVKVLPRCGDRYHCACVDRWLVTRPLCLLCRAPLRVDPAGPWV